MIGKKFNDMKRKKKIPFDLDEYIKKPDLEVVTKRYTPVTILKTDMKNCDGYTVLAIIQNSIGNEVPMLYNRKGQFISGQGDDEFDIFFFVDDERGELEEALNEILATYDEMNSNEHYDEFLHNAAAKLRLLVAKELGEKETDAYLRGFNDAYRAPFRGSVTLDYTDYPTESERYLGK